MSGDSYHITAPEPSGAGAYNAMKNALSNAQIDPTNINYINAHGTSTPLGDIIELQAVEKLMGSRLENLLMSSTKSSIGHLLGAAGAVEAIFSILAMKFSIAPPTLNLENKADEAKEFNLVAKFPIDKKINFCLSNSLVLEELTRHLFSKRFNNKFSMNSNKKIFVNYFIISFSYYLHSFF